MDVCRSIQQRRSRCRSSRIACSAGSEWPGQRNKPRDSRELLQNGIAAGGGKARADMAITFACS
jgi:hypothetical protein